ncbi:DUF1828 domain-containing protein [Loigolactobacillus backii]|uniref:DUF1828 domain-containing protein n=1 Tax=Loigolactobacillus backii TaxID=375175 RepID=UPI0022FD449D|nr:DUF1828 domain-containing protein [Loigolactobacillus backii]MDA5388987.1 DUF1828 domain-containing protein [Loigolactobacillus backii]MDA5391501.1 DUF1828 domain-containing protein [Loigolactobacillus backii]
MISDFNAMNLKNEYFDWLSEQESFSDVGSASRPVVEIKTPFLDDFSDGIDLYLYPDQDGQVLITDNGYTLDGLSTKGILFDKRSKTRNKIMADVLDTFGIEKQMNSKKLFIITKRNDFPNAKQRLLQGILKIIDLTYTESKSVFSLFTDEVANILTAKQILYNRSRAVVAPNGRSFIFDFMIPTKRNGDTLVRTFHSPQFTNSAKVFSWDASYIGRFTTNKPGKFIAVIDDQNAKQEQVNDFIAILNSEQQSSIEGISYSEMNAKMNAFTNC